MGDGFERVDVEAAISFIEHGIFRLEHGQLQNLGPFLLTAGKAFIDCPRGKGAIHSEKLHFFVKPGIKLGRFELFTLGQTRLHAGT